MNVKWRGMNAAYTASERELMRDLPVREQALVHTLKAFTHGEIILDWERGLPRAADTGASGPAFTPDDAQAETPSGVAWSHPSRGITGDLGGPLSESKTYTDPEDLEFGRPKKTRPIYALVWTHKQHKVYKTKAKAQRASRAWKLWHERWGFKVSSHATGFFALKGDEKRSCLIHEYDKDSKKRLK